MQTLRKFFVILVILTILLMAACTSAETEEPVVDDTTPEEEVVPEEETEPEPVTIQVYYPVAVDAPIASILQGYIDDFEAEYPYITVEAVFSGGYADVQTAIQTTIDGWRRTACSRCDAGNSSI